MPFKTDNKALGARMLKKSVRLLECQRERIRQLREQDEKKYSYNYLANMFGCSKRLVQFVCNPDKAQKAKEQFSERRKDGRYYKKEKHTEATRKHRRRKYNILKDTTE